MKYTKEQLQEILNEHVKWLRGRGGKRADLRGANLSDANLSDASLRRADLRGANFRGANLIGADFFGADLRGANFRGANLSDANLSNASLRRADLRRADLRGANLIGADFFGADLRGADFCRETQVAHIPLACPTDGAFIGWKKAQDKLVKLQIPEDARRLSATSNKCRCDKAVVLEITSLDGTVHFDVARSTHDSTFIYKVGETVYPREPFNEDRWEECSSGIHFFIDRQEAINYR